MDRIINVKVGGNHLTKDSNKAGTRGEANVTTLRITFDEGWDGYAKSVVFRDAHGMNPTRRTLTTDLLENIVESTEIYLVPIPAEPMWLAGEMSFTVEGYIGGRRQRSVMATLEVEDAIITDVMNNPTPSEVEQMQAQYESILADIVQAAESKTKAEAFAESAKNSMIGSGQARADTENIKQETIEETNAITARAEDAAETATTMANKANYEANRAEQAVSDVEALKQSTIEEATEALEGIKQEAMEEVEALKEDAGDYKEEATESANRASQDAQNAKKSAEEAEEFANRAENALGKTNYVGANGNWYVWSSAIEGYYDTGVRAQSGSEVYVGNNPPDSADVWIYPHGGVDDIILRLENLEREIAKLVVRTVTITLLASEWVNDGDKYSQIVTIEGVTPYSKVDLQPSAEQLIIFYEKDIAFVTENVNGVISVLCLGQKPTNDYVMQATITEVAE